MLLLNFVPYGQAWSGFKLFDQAIDVALPGTTRWFTRGTRAGAMEVKGFVQQMDP